MRRKLSAAVILGLLIVGLALPAQAHSFYGEGDCDGWTLHLDGTWNAYDITVDGVSIGLDQVVEIADTSDSTERTFVVRWWKTGPDVTRTVTVTRVLDCTPELTPQEIQIAGECAVDQSGQARAMFNAEGRPGAVFTVNGVEIGGALAGGTAQFGVNTWSVAALEGYVIVGPTEGSFTIEDCGTTTTTAPATTTTAPEVTTTTAEETTTTAETTTTTETGTPTTSPPDAPELPLTGIGGTVGLLLAGAALLGLGVSTVRASKRIPE